MPENLELGAQTLQGCLTLSWEWVEGHLQERAETGLPGPVGQQRN